MRSVHLEKVDGVRLIELCTIRQPQGQRQPGRPLIKWAQSCLSSPEDHWLVTVEAGQTGLRPWSKMKKRKIYFNQVYSRISKPERPSTYNILLSSRSFWSLATVALDWPSRKADIAACCCCCCSNSCCMAAVAASPAPGLKSHSAAKGNFCKESEKFPYREETEAYNSQKGLVSQ